jgi:hypothetical protein
MKKGVDKVTFVDSGATAHVANFMQGLNMIQTITKGTRRIKDANGVEFDVEAIGPLTLELHTGFSLQLNNLYY